MVTAAEARSSPGTLPPLPPVLDRVAFTTPGGNSVEFLVRPGTSDWNMCNAASGAHDEYGIPVYREGVMLDIGACMGSVSIPLLADNPMATLIAVEPRPENVALLRANLELNGILGRAEIVQGAAGSGQKGKVRIGYGAMDDPSDHHEFIGSQFAPEGVREVQVPRYGLKALVPEGPIEFLKIDCEGCEYSFLKGPEVDRVRLISGEVHFGWQRLVDLLSATHEVFGEGKDFGYFRAVHR